MEYRQFVTTILEELTCVLSPDVHCEIHETLKNNGLLRTGITFADSQTNLYPTIYMEEFYQQFQEGIPLDCIVDTIVQIYHEVRLDHIQDIEHIKTFSSIQSQIAYKLIHAEKNRELLKSMPYVPYYDLAIVFYVLFEADETGIGTIPITNQLTTLWCTNSEELPRIAQKNAPALLPATFRSMNEVLEDLLKGNGLYHLPPDSSLYVVSNTQNHFGAAAILYDGMLKNIADKLQENFFIIPSSVHEMLIVSESNSPGLKELCDMVAEINKDHVDPEEVLSDRVYFYDVGLCELL